MTPMWESDASQSSASFSVLREISVLSEQNWSGIWSCIPYPVYHTRGCKLSTCKRPTLFCSSDQLAYQQSGRSKEVCPTKLSPVFKKAPRSLCRGHIYDPKSRWRVWAPSKPSGPCVLLEPIWNRAQCCVEAPRDTSASVHVCVNSVQDERNPC